MNQINYKCAQHKAWQNADGMLSPAIRQALGVVRHFS